MNLRKTNHNFHYNYKRITKTNHNFHYNYKKVIKLTIISTTTITKEDQFWTKTLTIRDFEIKMNFFFVLKFMNLTRQLTIQSPIWKLNDGWHHNTNNDPDSIIRRSKIITKVKIDSSNKILWFRIQKVK